MSLATPQSAAAEPDNPPSLDIDAFAQRAAHLCTEISLMVKGYLLHAIWHDIENLEMLDQFYTIANCHSSFRRAISQGVMSRVAARAYSFGRVEDLRLFFRQADNFHAAFNGRPWTPRFAFSYLLEIEATHLDELVDCLTLNETLRIFSLLWLQELNIRCHEGDPDPLEKVRQLAVGLPTITHIRVKSYQNPSITPTLAFWQLQEWYDSICVLPGLEVVTIISPHRVIAEPGSKESDSKESDGEESDSKESRRALTGYELSAMMGDCHPGLQRIYIRCSWDEDYDIVDDIGFLGLKEGYARTFDSWTRMIGGRMEDEDPIESNGFRRQKETFSQCRPVSLLHEEEEELRRVYERLFPRNWALMAWP
ncbi:hypothetical protein HGRIS_014672 [Hohenbuehelia grisea]|uniref:Uncharacterized protein n=1 Tax=Hohenbuehelia grisea TaxID=104357 RepID=A0ABR3JWD6_9AGAR